MTHPVQGTRTTIPYRDGLGNLDNLQVDNQAGSGFGYLPVAEVIVYDGDQETIGAKGDTAATDDTSTWSAMAMFKRISAGIRGLIAQLPAALGATGGLKVEGTAGVNPSPIISVIADPIAPQTNRVTVAQFHNADNQVLPATAYGSLSGGVAQILNSAGTLDRQRGTGFNAQPAAGIASGSQQLAGPVLATTFGAAVTGNASAQTVTVASTANMKVGDVVQTQDAAAVQEATEVISIPSGTTFSAILKNSHANGVTLNWYHYNQAADASAGDNAPAAGVALEAVGMVNASGGIDRERANLDMGALITAASVTTTQTSADQTNYNGRGLKVALNVTTLTGTSPTLTLKVQYKDTVSGTYVAILTSVAISAVGFTTYTLYPGIATTANVAVSDVLPRTWNVTVVTGGTVTAASYTVSASVIH